MNIGDIYDRYDIMSNLREHQLRVAGVAKYICDHLSEKDFSEQHLVSACLIHDMGNIIKSDLLMFPEFITPDMLPYYEEVKRKMCEKYADEHTATLEIAKEIGVAKDVLMYLENARLLKYSEEEADISVQIYNYADMRVHPYGVRSLQERLDNLRERYEGREKKEHNAPFDREAFEKRLHDFEKNIFSFATCLPEDITDASIAPLIQELASYDIETVAS